MKWRIIADSSCDIFDLDHRPEDLYFATVPFVITVDDRDFVDNADLDVHELVSAMASSSKSYTSCPSPAEWVREFGEEGNVFAITISANLSGSYNSACTAREMVLEEQPDRKAAAAMMTITAAATILIGRWFFNRTVLTWRPAR